MQYPDGFYDYITPECRTRIRRRVTLARGPGTTIFDRRNAECEMDACADQYGVTRLIIARIMNV
jgi:hypothetical protein